MTITKNFTHNLFIATLIMLTMTNSHQLHAMALETIGTCDEIVMDADFQIYKLLSLIDQDHHSYLLPELIQTIATKVSKLIDKECYEKYGKCLKDSTKLLRFIEHKICNQSMSHISITTIIKRMLRHSDKSLSNIKSYKTGTVFHDALSIGVTSSNLRGQWIQILKLIAGSEAWNMIRTKNDLSHTALYHAVIGYYPTNELLSAAPNRQEAWNLILDHDECGNTILAHAFALKHPDIEFLESYRPKEQ